MFAYLTKVMQWLERFKEFQIIRILRAKNLCANSFACLASAPIHSRMIPVEFLMHPSINYVEEMIYSMDKKQTWMDPLIKYLKDGILHVDKLDAKKLQFKAACYYLIEDRMLYKQGFSIPCLYCLSADETDYMMREIRVEICDNHSIGRALTHIVIRQGYY